MASTSMATSMAVAKRSAEMALMPPPPRPKRIKRPQKVLDEETYTSALSHIIARDFFPGLLETESQQDYLDALDAGDDIWIEEAEKRVRELMNTPRVGRRGVSITPLRVEGQTPRGWRGETPVRTPAQVATPARSDAASLTGAAGSQVNLNLSLEAFQAKYTSEDNESFYKVLDKQNEKKREKYGWLWNGNMLPSARRIAQAAVEQKLLKQHGEEAQSRVVTLRPSQDLDARPASISQPRPHDPRNHFMFGPEGLEDTRPDLQTQHEASLERSRAAPASVSYNATRLPTVLQAEPTVAESPSLAAIDAAIAGHPRHRAISTAVPSEVGGGETPRVNGYAFVDAEPTPEEVYVHENPEAVQSALPTRDNRLLLRELIEARGENSSSGSNPFLILQDSPREQLHHRLVEKQLKSKRKAVASAAAGEAANLATPRFASAAGLPTPRRVAAASKAALTPAAQRLYDQVGGKTPLGRSGQPGHSAQSSRQGRAGAPGATPSAFDSWGSGGGSLDTDGARQGRTRAAARTPGK